MKAVRPLAHDAADENHMFDDRSQDRALAITRDNDNEDALLLQPEVPAALVFNGKSHTVMMTSPYDLEDFLVIDDRSCKNLELLSNIQD